MIVFLFMFSNDAYLLGQDLENIKQHAYIYNLIIEYVFYVEMSFVEPYIAEPVKLTFHKI